MNHDAGSDQSAGQGGVGGDGSETGSIVVGPSKTCTPGETRSCTNVLGCTVTDSCESPGVWADFQCGSGGTSCGTSCLWSLAQGCAWTFPLYDAGNAGEYNAINIFQMSGDAAQSGLPQSGLLPNVGAVGCEGLAEEALGWDYVRDDAGAAQQIILCPETCTRLGPDASLMVAINHCVLP